jgi:hypothetical protein
MGLVARFPGEKEALFWTLVRMSGTRKLTLASREGQSTRPVKTLRANEASEILRSHAIEGNKPRAERTSAVCNWCHAGFLWRTVRQKRLMTTSRRLVSSAVMELHTTEA